MIIQVGKLKEGQPFETLATHRRGIITKEFSRSYSDGVSVQLYNPDEDKIIHAEVRVEVP